MAFYDIVESKQYTYRYFLLKPDETELGEMSVLSPTLKETFKSIPELSFICPKNYIDDLEHPYFSQLKFGYLVKLLKCIDDTVVDTILFTVSKVDTIGDTKEYKQVQCFGVPYLWRGLKVRKWKKTLPLYEPGVSYEEDQDGNVIHGGVINYILEKMLYNTWTVGWVDGGVVPIIRTLDISESSVLELINECQSQWNCVIRFNYADKQIDLLGIDNTLLGSNQGLIISNENLLKKFQESIKTESIVTRLYVRGKDLQSVERTSSTNISGVNPTGQQYIDNFSAFRTAEYMSQGLRTALDDYDDLIDANRNTMTGYVNSRLSYESTLQQLQNELLILQGNLTTYQSKVSVCMDTGGTAPDNQNVQHDYFYWKQLEHQCRLDVQAKEDSITSAQNSLTAVNQSITSLQNQLSFESNFTLQERQELIKFIYEETVTIKTTNPVELYAVAQDLLTLKSQPHVEITVDIADFLQSIEYQHEWSKLSIGDQVNIDYRQFGYNTYEMRLIEYTHSPSNNTLTITLSNKDKRLSMTDEEYIAELLTHATKASNDIASERDTYKGYEETRNGIGGTGAIVRNGDTIDPSTNPIVGDKLTIGKDGVSGSSRADNNFALKYDADKIYASKTGFEVDQNNPTRKPYWELVSSDGIQTGGSDEERIQILRSGIKSYNANNELHGLVMNPTDQNNANGYADMYIYYENNPIYTVYNDVADVAIKLKGETFVNRAGGDGVVYFQGDLNFEYASSITGLSAPDVPAVDVQLYNDGAIITFNDNSEYDLTFVKNSDGKITQVINNTTEITMNIGYNNGNKL